MQGLRTGTPAAETWGPRLHTLVKKRSIWSRARRATVWAEGRQGPLCWPPPQVYGLWWDESQIPSERTRIQQLREQNQERLPRNFGIKRRRRPKKQVNSVKKTRGDRGEKENELQMGSCFIQGRHCRWGRPEARDRRGKWDAPTSKSHPLCHRALLAPPTPAPGDL